jgi:hypothetical protein
MLGNATTITRVGGMFSWVSKREYIWILTSEVF